MVDVNIVIFLEKVLCVMWGFVDCSLVLKYYIILMFSIKVSVINNMLYVIIVYNLGIVIRIIFSLLLVEK